MASDTTEEARRRWDQRAAGFDRSSDRMEPWLLQGAREWICAQAHGDVLEVAVGTGRSLSLFPPDARVTGVDLSPAMLAQARARATALGLDVDLREADAERLPFDDASFDSVVCVLSLCSVPDYPRAIAEMHRVLRPGGRLLLLDHIPSTNRLLLALMRLAQRFAPDEGLLRRPYLQVVAQGFEIEHASRQRAGIIERVVARKPA